jgi:hypothetical protein
MGRQRLPALRPRSNLRRRFDVSDSTVRVLCHTTPVRNLGSIRTFGLSPAFARGRMRVVWLHAPSRSRWATRHCAVRHHVADADMVLIRVAVPRAWLHRRSRGVWWCDQVIPPSCIVSIRPGVFAAAE